jgi:hypothetical protein
MEGIVQDLAQGVLAALALGAGGSGRAPVSSEAGASSASGRSAEPAGRSCPNSFAGPPLFSWPTGPARRSIRFVSVTMSRTPNPAAIRPSDTALAVADGLVVAHPHPRALELMALADTVQAIVVEVRAEHAAGRDGLEVAGVRGSVAVKVRPSRATRPGWPKLLTDRRLPGIPEKPAATVAGQVPSSPTALRIR